MGLPLRSQEEALGLPRVEDHTVFYDSNEKSEGPRATLKIDYVSLT